MDDANYHEARRQWTESMRAMEAQVLRMKLEREREQAFFKMAVDALRTLRNRAQLSGRSGDPWLVETEVIGHVEHVLRHTEEIATGKRKP